MKRIEIQDLTAVILAGGLGTRLRATIPDLPKALAKVGGKPFITYIFDQLHEAGIKEVVLCTGYLGDDIKRTFGDTYHSITLKYSKEDKPLGTAGALKLASGMINSDPVLVLNGDSICQYNLASMIDYYYATTAQGSILVSEVLDTSRFGTVLMEASGKITEFQEKTNSGHGRVNAGVYLLSRTLLSEIPAFEETSLEKELFPSWTNGPLYGFLSTGPLLDIGTAESYMNAQSEISFHTK